MCRDLQLIFFGPLAALISGRHVAAGDPLTNGHLYVLPGVCVSIAMFGLATGAELLVWGVLGITVTQWQCQSCSQQLIVLRG
jgi:hypothetical protein